MEKFEQKMKDLVTELIATGKELLAISIERDGSLVWLWVPSHLDDCVSEVVAVETDMAQLYPTGRIIAETYKAIGCEDEIPDVVLKLERERRIKEGQAILDNIM